MNNTRILFAVLWLVSVAAAYFIGQSGDPVTSNPSALSGGDASSSGTGTIGDSRDRLGIARPVGRVFDDANSDKPQSVKMLIARARAEMGGGMGGMMNLRGMLRAIAPIAELDDSQLQEALSEVDTTVKDPQQRMMFLSLLLGQWAEKDGKSALAYADEKLGKSGMFDMGIRSSIVGSWSLADPDGAWRWYESEGKGSTDDRTKMMTVSALFAGMAASNMDITIARLGTLSDEERGMAINGLAMSVRDDHSRQRLLDRAASMPGQQRDQIRQGIVSPWTMSDPDAAIAFVRALPAEEQKPLRENAGHMLLMMNPEKGAEFVLEGAADDQKPQLYDRVVGQWAAQNPEAAGEWLTKQTQGPELDNARRTYATIVARKDPAAAMDWAKSVTDTEQRAQSVQQVYIMWKVKDGAAADAALDASGLDAERVQAVREQVGKAGEATLPAPSVIN